VRNPGNTKRRLIFIAVLLFIPTTALAQCQNKRPTLQPLRYEEDWSLLADRDCKKEAIDNLKYIPLGRRNWYLSIGAETRFRYENYDNPGFGTDPESPNGYILQRSLLHTDWHFGRQFRLFTQFQSGLEEGRNGGPRLTDKDAPGSPSARYVCYSRSQANRVGVGFTRNQEHGGWSGYYIGLNRKRASFNGEAGQEIRETVGSRIWNQGTFFDYNTDFIFQTGSFANGHILAGAVSSNDGITLRNLKLRPRFGVRFDYASGDSDRSSRNLNTFNPLFPNPMYSSLSALLGPSNLTDLGPTIRLTIDSKTAMTPEVPFYWRSSIRDGIYGFAGNLIRPANLSSARFVGFQPGLVLERTFSSHFSSTAGYFHFLTGDFLKETPPGKNVGYFYATLTFRL
jgi:hypothetical protein